ncbi:putative RNA methyltransferase [Marinobacter sp. SS21]|uniref:putative RNA methyltransferase n=1 Tax=Marinobacter sp. SS21 TaxID=2979460 RepID=UPI00232A995D|nr:methyltransferase domain-containing protein [Marinobacter sp. SS21]MDC0664144.1 methyltransferase domain-containing protein [Marinobacter sp. SS21]
MNVIPFQDLCCPLDGLPLTGDGHSWRCGAGHCYDIARQGYTHLLPVQKKRSRDPGDSKAMVAARRRFLNGGHYRPIATAVSDALLASPAEAAALCCLDAGCGEGYYLRELAARAGDRSLALAGLDISKWAVQAAAKQDRQTRWLVGSNANLPVTTASLDRVLCLFGFPVYDEFARVLKAGGELLLVDAGPNHLRELREIVYPSLKPRGEKPWSAPTGFRSLVGDTVAYSLELTEAQAIADLLAMTPHLYRASAEGRARAAALNTLTVTVEVQLRRLQRLAEGE